MIVYTKDLSSITAEMLTGFFDGWSNPPNNKMHLKILQSKATRKIKSLF